MEEYLENTPSIPSNYVLYLTDILTAVTNETNSLFHGISVLSNDWDTEVYLPPEEDGKTITPHTVNGKATGFFEITGNSNVDIVVYYKNIETGNWYRREVNIAGSIVEFSFADAINVEPNSLLQPVARIYANEGRFLNKTEGEFSTDNGNTWVSNNSVLYVPNQTLYRTTVTSANDFSHVGTYTVSINGISRGFTYVTRHPKRPEFSQGSYAFDVNEGSVTVGNVYPDLSDEAVVLSLTGADSALFNIETNGDITTVGNLDYEVPEDVGTDNIYNFSVVASNGAYTVSVPTTVNLIDMEELPPIFDDPGPLSVPENENGSWIISLLQGTAPNVITLNPTDDSAFFDYDDQTNTLTTISPLDWEARSDSNGDNVFELSLSVTNDFGSDDINLTIEVTNVIEDIIPDPVSYGIEASLEPNEQVTLETVITGVEETAILNVTNGEISNDGGSSWTTDPLPFHAGLTRVRVTANAPAQYEQSLVLTTIVNGVEISGTLRTLNTPVDMPAPQQFVIEEYQAFVGRVIPIAGFGPIQFQIVGGADASLFDIDSDGNINFLIETDYHSPSDNGGDNIYDLRIRGFNGETEDFTDVTVTVTNVILPVRMPRSRYFRFIDSALEIGTISPLATDDDTWFEIEGTDAGLFSIDSDTGLISFLNEATFENPQDSDGNNKYNFDVVYSNAVSSSRTSVRVDIKSSAAIGKDIDKIATTTVTANSGVGSVFASEAIFAATI